MVFASPFCTAVWLTYATVCCIALLLETVQTVVLIHAADLRALRFNLALFTGHKAAGQLCQPQKYQRTTLVMLYTRCYVVTCAQATHKSLRSGNLEWLQLQAVQFPGSAAPEQL